MIESLESVNFAINIEIAIAKYEAELILVKYPQQWAEIHDNLGKAYCERIRGDWVKNGEKAIKAFEKALKVYTREEFPQKWASIQNSLATIYSDLGAIDEANTELAIFCCKKALPVYTREKFPTEWVMVLTNLGAAYRKRKQGEPVENLKIAISWYQAALEEHIYQCFKAGLEEHTYEDFLGNLEEFLEDWAGLQNNLGNIYRDLAKEEGTNNLEQVFYYFNHALEVYSCESYPLDWAMVQNNLALTYDQQGNINQAFACFRLSLKICTPTAFPTDCLQYGGNFGDKAFAVERWTEAIEGYDFAIKAIEQIRAWSRSEIRRQQILQGTIEVYEKIVQACINAGQIDKAFEYSERSRSKRLVDLMASYNLSQGEEIPPKVQELLQQYEELQQQIDQERQSHKSEDNRSDTRAAWEAYNEAIALLETQKQQVWENLRREDPVLAGEIQVNPLSLSEIQQLIDQPNTTILSFYTTNSDTHIFVVQQNKITLHTCTGQGLETLQGWISQNWLLPYMNDYKKWETQINSILRELAERLQISELISQHLQGIEELILVPHLLLHQIPFAALPTGEYQEYLGDKFLIRYTQSCQILEFCQQRDNVGKFNEISLQYGTVEDAEDNLPCARFEGEKLAQMYNIPSENRLIGSSQATSNNYRQLAQQVQVLHSCHHAQSRLDNPLESQLKLAHGNSITLGQLMTSGWRLPQLIEVFLSCCETNLGIPSLTDDILTLSTGFLCAGARSVVSTLWSVNDLATALFSIFYYQQRQEGRNRPEALQQAQIQLREFTKVDLNKVFHEVEAREKELIRNRKKYPSGSIEHEQWKGEYNMYAKLNSRIQEIENSTQQFPFSDPRYWAAFICHGLQ
ncbi:CHAT domain-containing protein [Nostoc sp. KVJ3]|uniref:CHAT domain-containing protein n=1 Tax=Nostoc sp. KVJ3 TaxID=457945 RepID=UPI002237703F|nr:CHAT domain-containing tetratricopeptide repeat protein [Nostoc sp. KVJ3]MCW5316345.1 CHAT domain-containing protein [Nostoc sp. KVJ3]